MYGLRPEWRELEWEELYEELEDEYRENLRIVKGDKRGRRLGKLLKELMLAEMRLDVQGAPVRLLEESDPRLPYFRPIGVLTFLIVPVVTEQSVVLAFNLLMECANAGFVVGYETAKQRWVPQKCKEAPMWTRLFNPQKALAVKMADAAGNLIVEIAAAQEGVVGEVGADPPWHIEQRLSLQMVHSIAVLLVIDPTEARLTGTILDMLRSGFVIGYSYANAQWPPKPARGQELSRLKEKMNDMRDAGKRQAERLG